MIAVTACLAAQYGADARDREQARGRRRVDHVALLAGCDHARQEGLEAVYDPPEVDARQPLPIVEVVLPDGTVGQQNTGVVAQHVHSPEGLGRPLRQPDEVADVGHVGRHGQDSAVTLLGERLASGGQAIDLDIRHHHVHALAPEPPTHAEADSAGCPGYDGRAADKGLHEETITPIATGGEDAETVPSALRRGCQPTDLKLAPDAIRCSCAAPVCRPHASAGGPQ